MTPWLHLAGEVHEEPHSKVARRFHANGTRSEKETFLACRLNLFLK